MRSSTTKLSVAMSSFVLVLGALSVAAVPSRPGMFLYPLRELTHRLTGHFVETIVIAVPATLREAGVPVLDSDPVLSLPTPDIPAAVDVISPVEEPTPTSVPPTESVGEAKPVRATVAATPTVVPTAADTMNQNDPAAIPQLEPAPADGSGTTTADWRKVDSGTQGGASDSAPSPPSPQRSSDKPSGGEQPSHESDDE